MATIALRVMDLYGLLLALRYYVQLQRYWWIRELEEEDDDES